MTPIKFIKIQRGCASHWQVPTSFNGLRAEATCPHASIRALQNYNARLGEVNWIEIIIGHSILNSVGLDNFFWCDYLYLYYYINHLRIGGSIFYHGNFLLYSFYPSIRRILFIFGWSRHWSYVIASIDPLFTSLIYYYFHNIIFLFSNFVHIW
jgi:hypothetical protein